MASAFIGNIFVISYGDCITSLTNDVVFFTSKKLI